MPIEPESDLHWTAFLYVSGELTADESSGFERLLAESQEAREAVAGAVELAGALAIVGGERARRRASPGRRSARRALVGAALVAAAACLVLAIAPAFRPARPDPSEVAAAWSGLRSGADADWMAFAAGSQQPDSIEPGPADPGIVAIGAADEPSGERILPSWLLSAASSPRAETPRVED